MKSPGVADAMVELMRLRDQVAKQTAYLNGANQLARSAQWLAYWADEILRNRHAEGAADTLRQKIAEVRQDLRRMETYHG